MATRVRAYRRKGKVVRSHMRRAGVLKVSGALHGKSDQSRDMLFKALKPGKRRSKSGKIYYENRRNRADRDGRMS